MAPAVHNRQSHFSHGTGDVLQKPGRVALVHNGIIRLHEELRRALQAKGYAFSSQTDTRVVHLVDSLYDGDDVRGAGGCGAATAWRIRHCCLLQGRPHRVVAHGPVAVDWAWARTIPKFLASAMALAGVTDQIVYLEEAIWWTCN
jgi:glucosamine--fructose-6-phosphate aminotransferase (isomerizing)